MTKHFPAKENQSASFAPFGLFTPLNEMLARASGDCINGCQAWHEEVSRFVGRRFERDIELGRRLLSCRDRSEAIRLQQEWLAATAQEYADQAKRMTELAGSFTSSGSSVSPKSEPSARQADAA